MRYMNHGMERAGSRISVYTGNRKIEWVKIDPEFKIRMDINYINNSLTVKPDHVPVRRLTNKLIVVYAVFHKFYFIID